MQVQMLAGDGGVSAVKEERQAGDGGESAAKEEVQQGLDDSAAQPQVCHTSQSACWNQCAWAWLRPARYVAWQVAESIVLVCTCGCCVEQRAA